jgi:hypothetical protein
MMLCFDMGSLTQWRVEKWACRRLTGRSKKNFVLTRGNGAQHAIVIISDGRGLDLEDLATGFENLDAPSITLCTRGNYKLRHPLGSTTDNEFGDPSISVVFTPGWGD